MHDAIEMHDSTLGEAVWEGSDLVLRLRPAYVHRSVGNPAVDPGTGWLQDVDLRVIGARVDRLPAALDCWLADGELTVDGESWDNVIPVPLVRGGATSFVATTENNEAVVVSGAGVDLQARGEARYCEEVQ